MCTLVLLHRPDHDWPLLLAANRDELAGRPARPPGRHWPDRAEVRAGLDELAGGSWLGVNDSGVVAAVLNRTGTLGPADGKRSRGELVLEALDHREAAAAAEALVDLDPRAYRPFNLVIADRDGVFCLRHAGDGAIRVDRLPPGLTRASPTISAARGSAAIGLCSWPLHPPILSAPTGRTGSSCSPAARTAGRIRATRCASSPTASTAP